MGDGGAADNFEGFAVKIERPAEFEFSEFEAQHRRIVPGDVENVASEQGIPRLRCPPVVAVA